MLSPDTFPALDIKFLRDGSVLLEQDDGCGNVDTIGMHPAHVAHVAERLGLIEKGVLGARAQVEMLRRRLETLKYRLDQLTDMLNLCGEHENLRPEQDYAMATWEIAVEFCNDLDHACGKAVPQVLPEALQRSPTDTGASATPATAPATVEPQAPIAGAVAAQLDLID